MIVAPYTDREICVMAHGAKPEKGPCDFTALFQPQTNIKFDTMQAQLTLRENNYKLF